MDRETEARQEPGLCGLTQTHTTPLGWIFFLGGEGVEPVCIHEHTGLYHLAGRAFPHPG